MLLHSLNIHRSQTLNNSEYDCPLKYTSLSNILVKRRSTAPVPGSAAACPDGAQSCQGLGEVRVDG